MTESFSERVCALRVQIEKTTGDVLINTEHFASVMSILCASWAENRRVIFPPNMQPETIRQLSLSRDLLVLGGFQNDQKQTLTKIDFNLLNEPEDDVVVAEFHTSGSSGIPLCVEKKAGQLFRESRLLADVFQIDCQKTLMSGVPIRHMYGFLFSVMIPKVSGCSLVAEKPLSTGSISRVFRAFSVDIFVSSPAQLRSLASVEAPPRIPMIFSSGAPLHQQTRLKLEANKTSVVEIFGSTETGGIAMRREKTQWWTPLPGVQVKSDPTDKLLIRSPFLENANSFYLTEDRIEIFEGKFRHLGRADDVVKIGGKRVSKLELTNAILSHSQVEDAVIAVMEDGTRSLHAFVVMNGEAANLRKELGNKFDPTIIPRLHIVDFLPRTELGKLSRKDLNIMIKNTTDIEIIKTISSDENAKIQVFVPKNCFYFDGHFDDFPILPGVAQLKLVEKIVSDIWKLSIPTKATRLKFKSPIRPESHLDISLKRMGNEIAYTIHHADVSCASGIFEYDHEEVNEQEL